MIGLTVALELRLSLVDPADPTRNRGFMKPVPPDIAADGDELLAFVDEFEPKLLRSLRLLVSNWRDGTLENPHAEEDAVS